MRKMLLITLIVVNIVLLGALASKVLRVSDARAQPIGTSGNYLMVSGGVLGSTADAVYLIDLTRRQLYALMYDRGTRQATQVGSRDLLRDLGGATAAIRETPTPKRRPRR